jgi:geranylgeranyl diphosphate synthase type II
MPNFENILLNKAKSVERSLARYIKTIPNAPQVIIDAMDYSLSAGGKRVRPALLMMTASAFGLKEEDVKPAACALEMLHTYSLIHDDLPAMDNDDLRRGKPTNHIIYGEDTAILAGDALLTFAFLTLAKNGSNSKVGPARALKAVEILALRGGVSGMVGGQVSDVFAEGILEGKSKRAAKIKDKNLSKKGQKYFLLPKNIKEYTPQTLLKYIHANKTGALICAAAEMGAVLAGASENDFKSIRAYAQNIGFAFQVADDILDVTATKKQLGKSNSDAQNKKLTFVTLYGLKKAKSAAQDAVKKAHLALNRVKGARKEALAPLHQMADFIIERTY